MAKVGVHFFSAFTAALALFTVSEAWALSCPSNAVEIGRSESSTQRAVRCRCVAGYWEINQRCEPLQLSDSDLSLTNGEAFDLSSALHSFAIKRDWSIADRQGFVAALREASFGDFKRAGQILKALSRNAADHPTVQKVINVIASFDARQKIHPRELNAQDEEITGGFMDRISQYLDEDILRIFRKIEREQEAARRFMSLSPVSHHAATIRHHVATAAYLRSVGEYDRSIEALRKAGDLTERLGNVFGAMNPTISSEANPAADFHLLIQSDVVETRLLRRREQERKLPPEELEARHRKLQQEKAAVRAYELAFTLSREVPKEIALELVADAKRRLAGVGRSGRYDEQWMLDELSKVIEQDNDLLPHEIGYGFFENKSDTALLLDSLEYGVGDWERSVRFLELLVMHDPYSAAKKSALKRLHAFREIAESRDAGDARQ